MFFNVFFICNLMFLTSMIVTIRTEGLYVLAKFGSVR